MTLHIVTKSPFSSSSFHDCLEAVSAGDVLLLLTDGILASQLSEAHSSDCLVYCLAEDLALYGLPEPEAVKVTDYQGFVELTAQHRPVVTWY